MAFSKSCLIFKYAYERYINFSLDSSNICKSNNIYLGNVPCNYEIVNLDGKLPNLTIYYYYHVFIKFSIKTLKHIKKIILIHMKLCLRKCKLKK